MKNILKNTLLVTLVCTVLPVMGALAQPTFHGQVFEPDASERNYLNQGFEAYTIFELDPQEFYSFIDQNREMAEFSLEVGSFQASIELYENELRAPGYVVAQTGDDGYLELPIDEACITFAGYLTGSSKDVRLNIQRHRFWGYISTEEGKFYIEPLNRFIKEFDENFFILYNAAELIQNDEIKCNAEDGDRFKGHHSSFETPKAGDDCRKLEIATESAYELYDEGITINDIIGNLNLVESIYMNYFNMKFLITYQHEWTTSADPYTTSSSGCGDFGELDEFAIEWFSNFGNVRRDINVLYTEKDYSGSTIGCAMTGEFGDGQDNDGTVNNGVVRGAYCVNEWDWDDTSDAERQTLVAHEIGHVFGASHDESSNCSNIMCPSLTVSTVFNSTSQSQMTADMDFDIPGIAHPNDGRSAIRERFLPAVSGGAIIEFFSAVRSANVLNLDGNLLQMGLFGSINSTYRATESIKLGPGFYATAEAGDQVFLQIGSCSTAQGLAPETTSGTDFSGIEQSTFTSMEMAVYPNPTTGEINVQILSEEENTVQIEVLDLLGRTLNLVGALTLAEGTQLFQVRLDEYPSGIYLIVLRGLDGERIETLKVRKL